MMQIEAIDIEQTFTVRKSKWRYVVAHPLQNFFRSRKISNKKLAKVIEVSSVMMGHWLSGRIPMPDLREQQLEALADKIKAFEAAHDGVLFNSDGAPKRKAIKGQK